METYSFASVGVEANDMSAIKSVLKLVSGPAADWQPVEDPEKADATFLCGVTADQLSALSAKLKSFTALVYCCGRGETPPNGMLTLRRPLKASDLTPIWDASQKAHEARKTQAAKTEADEKAKAKAEAEKKKEEEIDLSVFEGWA